ncbi:hypothetical protein [Microbispora sp. H11081]|uniref:hypothetical protein n=1 Tax=Microbispora sp. H11081 TaxID=2729107 RepID=UPI00147433AB|nr:hypothetical protein [Microbispora sp. H11081]
MTELSQTLNERAADSETVQRALTYYLAESTDLSPQEMRAELTAAIGAGELRDHLHRLESDALLLDNAALWTLSEAWADEGPERVSTILDQAEAKLSLAETAIIAVSAVYGLHLLITKGRLRTIKRTRRNPDGTFTHSEETTFADPTGLFGSLISQLRRGGAGELPPGEGDQTP